MNTKETKKTQQSGVNYELPRSLKATLPILGITLLVIGFILNFNTTDKIRSIINKSLVINTKCRASFNQLESEPITLGYNLIDFSTTGNCDKKLSALKSVYVGFRGVSFTPLGLRLKSILQVENLGPIEMTLSLGLKEFEILASDQKISLANAVSLLDAPLKLSGKSIINAALFGKYSRLEGGDISIKIKNLKVKQQEIQSFIVPQINLQNNNINVKITKANTLKVNSISLGSPSDILEILAQGEVKNFNNPKNSQLKIEGKFNFKQEFNDKIPLLNLLLNGKNKKQGYYQFDLSGKAHSPKFNIK